LTAITVEGDKALIKALKALTGPQMKSAIRKGTRDGQRPIAAEVKRQVRKKSGALQRSVKVRSMKRSRTRIGSTCVMGGAGLKEPFYGIFQEYGTKYIKASKVMTNIADRLGPTALLRCENTIWDKVQDIWAGG
jgi:HK97 gp10 family phage protein